LNRLFVGGGTTEGGTWLNEIGHWESVIKGYILLWSLPVTTTLCFLAVLGYSSAPAHELKRLKP
jgi:hypothetical protein